MRSREWLQGFFAFAVLLVGCGDSEDHDTSSEQGNIGAHCILADEERPDFSGFALQEVSYASDAPECDGGYCLAYHFQGRVSCPYGQTVEEATTDPQCFAPDSQEPISVPVDPQLLARSASETVTCSCQCDGTGDGPFCDCPRGTVCEPILGGLGGSFCVSRDTVYDPTHPPFPDTCDRGRLNCGDPGPF